MSEEIKNNQIPKEIKDICRSCEENIHCQNKGCAFRSLGNEYCDYILNATRLYLDLQQKVEQQEKEIERLNNIINELERWLKEDLKNNYRDAGYRHNLIIEVLDKLKELKDSD